MTVAPLPPLVIKVATWGAVASVVVAALVVGVHVLTALARRYGTDETPMGTHTYSFRGEDPELRRRTAMKRRRIEDQRLSDLLVQSGGRTASGNTDIRRIG